MKTYSNHHAQQEEEQIQQKPEHQHEALLLEVMLNLIHTPLMCAVHCAYK